jgi:hypothetical protein
MYVIRHHVVRTATGWTPTNRRGHERLSSSLKCTDRPSGVPQAFPWGLKRPGSKADNSPNLVLGLRNVWHSTPTTPFSFVASTGMALVETCLKLVLNGIKTISYKCVICVTPFWKSCFLYAFYSFDINVWRTFSFAKWFCERRCV